ncbi:protein jag [Thermoproteota archaeon]
MKEKNSFFSFIKGISRVNDFSEEEAHQRDYAMSKERRERDKELEEEFVRAPSVTIDENAITITEEMESYAIERLEDMLRLSGFSFKVNIRKDNPKSLNIDILDADDISRIIGKDANTLNALQTLLRAMLFRKFHEPIKLTLDAGDYRKRRLESIESQARKAARLVLQNGRKIELKPMNSAERREVHCLFQNDNRIHSFSVGDEPNRRIVLEKKSPNQS